MIEDIILRHSQRGMDVLRPYMPKAFCVRISRSSSLTKRLHNAGFGSAYGLTIMSEFLILQP